MQTAYANIERGLERHEIVGQALALVAQLISARTEADALPPSIRKGPVCERQTSPLQKSAMENFICVQCGTQFSETAKPPLSCPICEDERQFVRHGGQEWTTLKRLTADHQNRFEEEARHLLGIGTEPEFAIGQRALLVQSPAGNLLWDCITLLDDRNNRGGQRARRHPRDRDIASALLSSMVEWSERFDAQIFLHSADREWVDAQKPRIQFWEGTTLSSLG